MAVAPNIYQKPADVLAWLAAQGAKQLTLDSRAVPALLAASPQAQVAFIAWPGAATDGRAYVRQALSDGAAAVLVEADGLETWQNTVDMSDVRCCAVRGLKAMLPVLANDFFGEPSKQLDVVAVTGTNGKTSTAWWLAQALLAQQKTAAVAGTLGIGRPDQTNWQATGLTTPDPVTWQAALHRLVDAGTQVVALEASSIGLQEHRLDATQIRVAVYTNFTQDHLDYHGSMDDYWLAKRRLFEWPGLQAAVIYMGDDKANALAEFCRQRELAVWTCAINAPARLQALNVQWHATGMQLTVRENDPITGLALAELPLSLPLLGEFNVANVLGVIGVLRALGESLAEALSACASLTAVPGRMQMVMSSLVPAPLAVVDYAHTPDALKNALVALRPVVQARGGRLWCVFGCGGSRDALKRPLMGAMASQYADEVVLTSDNPRNESPSLILSQILAGVAKQDGVAVIENRAEAIDHALLRAANEDVILLAGKGHETTQEVAGVKTPFDDAQAARSALDRRLAA